MCGKQIHMCWRVIDFDVNNIGGVVNFEDDNSPATENITHYNKYI